MTPIEESSQHVAHPKEARKTLKHGSLATIISSSDDLIFEQSNSDCESAFIFASESKDGNLHVII